MKFLVTLIAVTLVGCTTVNIYHPENEPVIIIHKSGSKNLDNPYFKGK